MYINVLGILDSDTDVDITAAEYHDSYFILPFDLTPTGDNGYNPHKHSSGNISFTAQLRSPLDHPMTVLVYAVYENCIEVGFFFKKDFFRLKYF